MPASDRAREGGGVIEDPLGQENHRGCAEGGDGLLSSALRCRQVGTRRCRIPLDDQAKLIVRDPRKTAPFGVRPSSEFLVISPRSPTPLGPDPRTKTNSSV